jgi:hypothetical protein
VAPGDTITVVCTDRGARLQPAGVASFVVSGEDVSITGYPVLVPVVAEPDVPAAASSGPAFQCVIEWSFDADEAETVTDAARACVDAVRASPGPVVLVNGEQVDLSEDPEFGEVDVTG